MLHLEDDEGKTITWDCNPSCLSNILVDDIPYFSYSLNRRLLLVADDKAILTRF